MRWIHCPAGAKAMAVLRGEADAYIHEGLLHEWDVAVPAAVLIKNRFHVSDLEGHPLIFNTPKPDLSEFLICRTELADEILSTIRLAIRT